MTLPISKESALTFATLLDRYRVGVLRDNPPNDTRKTNREMNNAYDAVMAYVAELESRRPSPVSIERDAQGPLCDKRFPHSTAPHKISGGIIQAWCELPAGHSGDCGFERSQPIEREAAPNPRSRFASQHSTFVCTCGDPASRHEGDSPLDLADGRCLVVGCPCERYTDAGVAAAAKAIEREVGTEATRSQILRLRAVAEQWYQIGLTCPKVWDHEAKDAIARNYPLPDPSAPSSSVSDTLTAEVERLRRLHRIDMRFFSAVQRAVNSGIAGIDGAEVGIRHALDDRRAAIAADPPLTDDDATKIIQSADTLTATGSDQRWQAFVDGCMNADCISNAHKSLSYAFRLARAKAAADEYVGTPPSNTPAP